MWTYPARVRRVIDGDTLELDIDLGFHVGYRCSVRLAGVNCPEPDEPGGAAAAGYVVEVLAGANDRVIVHTQRDPDRSFARYVADVSVSGSDLAGLLIAAGHGQPT